MTVNTDKRKKITISKDQKSNEIPVIPDNLPLLPLRDLVLFLIVEIALMNPILVLDVCRKMLPKQSQRE